MLNAHFQCLPYLLFLREKEEDKTNKKKINETEDLKIPLIFNEHGEEIDDTEVSFLILLVKIK